jgi:hypothetical protein
MAAAAWFPGAGKVIVHGRKNRSRDVSGTVGISARRSIRQFVAAIDHEQSGRTQQSVKFLYGDQRRESGFSHWRIIAATTATHNSPLQSARD